MFYASNFVFDSVPSEFYGVEILKFERTGGFEKSSAGVTTNINQKWIYRREKPYHFGNSLNEPLTFDISIGSSNSISGIDRSKLSKWLLGRRGYLPFQIVQDDLEDAFFNVIFVSAEYEYVAGLCVGMTLHAQCDAPWGYTAEKAIRYSFAENQIQNFDFTFFNDSASNDYLYPKISFELNSVGSSFQITNYSDNNRIFLFSDLQANEEIEIDNSLQTVSSSTGFYRLSSFNKNWLRFVPGANNLNVVSGIGEFDIYYKLARAIGG